MKTLVINEPFVPYFCRTQRWAARTRGRVLRPPDWLAYATAVLEQAGVDVELYDFPALNWGKARLRSLVRDKQPQYVVLDSTTPSIYSDIDCARIVKEEAGSTIIMVGPHVSAVPDETLDISKGAIDIIVRGEYDYSVRDIIRVLEDGSNLKNVLGISYLKKGQVVHTPNRPLIPELDALPFPAWHQLDILKYYAGDKLYPYMNIIAGRGCPFRCIFCLWPQVMHGRHYRLRSAKNVVDEMEYNLLNWPKIKKGELFFEDDTFTINRKRALEICQELSDRKLGITWSANARSDTYDLELFKKMKAAGCRDLVVGLESGDQTILDRIKKGITLNQSREFIRTAHRAGLLVHGCFVIGLPGETQSSIEKTLRFAMEVNLDTLQFSGSIPFPGTEYYDYCKEAGLLKASSWADWLDEGEQTAVVEYPNLTKAQINHYVDKGLRDFYFRPKFMFKFLFNTRSFSDLQRKLLGAKNFISYLFSENRLVKTLRRKV